MYNVKIILKTKMVDNVLLNNGYSNRVMQMIKEKKETSKIRSPHQ